MKKLIFTSALATSLILAACGSGEESTESTDNSAEVEQLQEQVAQLEEENAQLQEQLDNTNTAVEEDKEDSESDSVEVENESSRSNPLALGETTEVKVVTYDDEGEELTGKANVTVDNVLRGQDALDYMNSGGMGTYDQYDEEEGYEWIVFDLIFELTDFVDADTPYFAGENIEVIKEDGSQAPAVMAVIDDEFPAGEIYEGASVSGKVARPAPIDEPFQIKYDDYMDAEVWYQVD